MALTTLIFAVGSVELSIFMKGRIVQLIKLILLQLEITTFSLSNSTAPAKYNGLKPSVKLVGITKHLGFQLTLLVITITSLVELEVERLLLVLLTLTLWLELLMVLY